MRRSLVICVRDGDIFFGKVLGLKNVSRSHEIFSRNSWDGSPHALAKDSSMDTLDLRRPLKVGGSLFYISIKSLVPEPKRVRRAPDSEIGDAISLAKLVIETDQLLANTAILVSGVHYG